jgi:protein arginine kinase
VQTAAGHIPVLAGALYFDVEELEESDVEFLVERRLISRDLAAGDRARGVLVGSGESLTVMINEEDHLRLQGVVSGFRLGEALDRVIGVDDLLDAHLEYSYSPRLGYLTACPTNVGTGMRASVLVHLPALHLTGESRKVMQGAAAMGLAVRGFYGEGSQMMGNFVQVSNHVTLGTSEDEIVRGLSEKVQKVIESEQRARDTLWSDARVQVEDKVYRAYGLLLHARSIKAAEVLNLTSAVRFGLAFDLPGLCSAEALGEVLLLSQPGHIMKMSKRLVTKEERRSLRADFIRARLAAEEVGGGV